MVDCQHQCCYLTWFHCHRCRWMPLDAGGDLPAEPSDEDIERSRGYRPLCDQLCCYGCTFLPCCCVVALATCRCDGGGGVPTKANQLKWSRPGWYAKGMHAIEKNDTAGLRQIVDTTGWKPDNANQKFEVRGHIQCDQLYSSNCGGCCGDEGAVYHDGHHDCCLCCWPPISYEYVASSSGGGTSLMDAANASGDTAVGRLLLLKQQQREAVDRASAAAGAVGAHRGLVCNRRLDHRPPEGHGSV